MKLKFTLIAAFSTLILQFRSAPHYVEEMYEADNGDTVKFVTGNGPDIRLTVSGEGEKKKYHVTVQVPAGPGLRNAVTLQLDGNKTRDRIAGLLVAASKTRFHDDEAARIIATGDDGQPEA